MPIPKKLQYILGFIEDSLDASLTLDVLALEAQLSKFHFARAFKAYFGLPPLDVVRRYRMKRAGNQLAFRDLLSITDIALQAGYQNTESFSRAFQQMLKCTPTEFRQSADIAKANALLDPINDWKQAMAMDTRFTVEIVNIETIQIAQLIHTGPPDKLGTSLQQFIGWRKKHQLPPTKSRTFNLLYDDPSQVAPEQYRFGLACEISQPLVDDNAQLTESTIPAGRYAKVRHVGSDSVLEHIVNFLYGSWLPTSQECLGRFPLFFERISLSPDVVETEAVTDVFLPLA